MLAIGTSGTGCKHRYRTKQLILVRERDKPKPLTQTETAAAGIQIARVTLAIKLVSNPDIFQFANDAPPLSVTDGAAASPARIPGSATIAR
jgi:hypothetical protein